MKFQLAISNIAWAPEDDQAVYALMQKYHFCGLEIAPTRIFPADPYSDLNRARDWQKRLQAEYGFVVPSMQSIWYGRKENIFASQEDREALVDYTRSAIAFAAACGISNLVFGCPRNRNMPEGADPSVGIAFFRRIAQYAADAGCVIGLEANPPMYNTNYINTTEQALQMIGEVAHPGLQLNLDVGTMIANGESIDVLKNSISSIHHVHISEPGLKPVERRSLHGDLAGFLREGGYRGAVSVEMGRGDVSTIEEIMKYVSDIFGGDE